MTALFQFLYMCIAIAVITRNNITSSNSEPTLASTLGAQRSYTGEICLSKQLQGKSNTRDVREFESESTKTCVIVQNMCRPTTAGGPSALSDPGPAGAPRLRRPAFAEPADLATVSGAKTCVTVQNMCHRPKHVSPSKTCVDRRRRRRRRRLWTSPGPVFFSRTQTYIRTYVRRGAALSMAFVAKLSTCLSGAQTTDSAHRPKHVSTVVAVAVAVVFGKEKRAMCASCGNYTGACFTYVRTQRNITPTYVRTYTRNVSLRTYVRNICIRTYVRIRTCI